MTVRTRLINRRYRLERRIAVAESTETWLGFDNVLHRAVAVSMPRQELLRNGPFLVQFLQRSRIATALHHRGIVAALDSGEEGDTPYLISEYLGGDSLSDIIRAESPFDVDDVAVLIEQLAAALDFAHQRGFVHGQLSPDDASVDGEGFSKLSGLGLPIGSTSTNAEDPLTIDRDIESLAAIAFEMLTGDQLDSDGGEAYLIDPDVPRNASDIVTIGLGVAPTRFASAGAFARSLSNWRAFDPGEFFVSPAIDPRRDEQAAPLPAPPPDWELIPNFEPQSTLVDDHPWPESRFSASQRAVWAMAAVLALALIASAIVWNSTETDSTTSNTLPAPVLELARLSAF